MDDNRSPRQGSFWQVVGVWVGLKCLDLVTDHVLQFALDAALNLIG
jgi:hypothetical protein